MNRTALDEQLFWVLNGHSSTPLDYLMGAVTYTASLVPAVTLALLAMFLYKGLRAKHIYLLAASMALAGVVTHSIKPFYNADRPLAYFAKKNPSQEGSVHAPFEQHRVNSFPSGHSQVAFSVAAFMALVFRRHIFAWFSWALLAAISRVYLGVHFPFDALIGALVGAIVTFLTVKIATLSSMPEEPRKPTDNSV